MFIPWGVFFLQRRGSLPQKGKGRDQENKAYNFNVPNGRYTYVIKINNTSDS